MFVNFLIGHRGVGKSSLLNRIPHYIANALCIDLDKQIELNENSTVAEIFAKYGEEYFRQLELKTLEGILRSLDTKNEHYIALGAGFRLERLSEVKEKNILWVKRISDKSGRVFFDRPLLNTGLNPLNDYLSRFAEREKLYSQFYTESLILAEGANEINDAEKLFFKNKINVENASITLLPEHFRNFSSWVNKRLSWNFNYFELRTDLLTKTQIDEAFKLIPGNKILLSYRTRDFGLLKTPSEVKLDWPLEMGEPPFRVDFVSLHSLNQTLDETLLALSKRKEKIKLSLNITNLSDLIKCHHWFLADTKNRNFLPRGDFALWYRLFIKNKSEINFIREDRGSSQDQPTLMMWLNTKGFNSNFYAVLGDPIEHSHSPYFHRNLGTFLPIKLSKNNFKDSMDLLIKLGLKGAAVTSPLKEVAFELSTDKTPVCESLKSANTLLIQNQKIIAHNTDYDALIECLSKFKESLKIAVWGGGGVLNSILTVLPQAVCFSASKAEPRDFKVNIENFLPEIVIWAAPNVNKPQMPFPHWQPKIVFDLNYADSSLGKEYALITKAEYISGLKMFNKQAENQLKFWISNEC